MSGTNHHARMWREYDRRVKKKNGNYDLGDFVLDLYRENVKLKDRIKEERAHRDRIEYGI